MVDPVSLDCITALAAKPSMSVRASMAFACVHGPANLKAAFRKRNRRTAHTPGNGSHVGAPRLEKTRDCGLWPEVDQFREGPEEVNQVQAARYQVEVYGASAPMQVTATFCSSCQVVVAVTARDTNGSACRTKRARQ